MAAGSASQASQLVSRGGSGRAGAGGEARPAGAVTRRSTGSSARSKAQGQQYYTDDTPGLKISPVMVIGMSITFIVCVTVLHIIGKIRGV
ncbi:hypothetical protein FOA52_000015 [Chlamydomonas sp. UWO 241]|nr:hypothetical protein FOA52_000015 [Chlamydomonas sp. UWO 241]